MDHYKFDYSMKNVPIPSDKAFRIEFLNSIDKLSIRMKWRAFHFLNPNPNKTSKETFNFNTTNPPPPIKELKAFLDGLSEIAKNLKFKQVKDQFQSTLKKDLKTSTRKKKW